MCRLAIMLLVSSAAGCSAPPPNLRPFVAVAVRYWIQAAAAPAPSPDVVPGVCKNCRGAKVVGDGRIKITCPVCNGTGVEPKSVLVAPPAPQCKDGTCPTPAIRR